MIQRITENFQKTLTKNGYNFTEVSSETNVDHHNGNLADFNGQPLIAAGYFDEAGTTEVLGETFETKSTNRLLSKSSKFLLIVDKHDHSVLQSVHRNENFYRTVLTDLGEI